MKSRPSALSPTARAGERVQRRRERTKASALAAGATQFYSRANRPLSIEELGVEASRALFYTLFANKYSLLASIFNPIFEIPALRIRELDERPTEQAVAGLVDVHSSPLGAH